LDGFVEDCGGSTGEERGPGPARHLDDSCDI
jgi:hypothetical protein